jgi:hypothetical protein
MRDSVTEIDAETEVRFQTLLQVITHRFRFRILLQQTIFYM